MLKVATSLCLAAVTRTSPKKGVEDVAKSAETVEPVKRLTGSAVRADSRQAESVVLSSFISVGKDLVGLVYFFELIFSIGAFIAIGMEFHGFLPKSSTDVLFTDASAYTEDIVIIPVSHL